MSNAFIQPLESRLLFSNSLNPGLVQLPDAFASIRKGILIIHGGNGNDRISLSAKSPFSSRRVIFPPPQDGTLVVRVNGKTATFKFGDITQIRIEGGGGGDDIKVLPIPPLPTCPSGGVWEYPGFSQPLGWENEPTIILGGDGNDTIVGGDLSDTINGGRGDDLIFGRSGDDRIFGGAGNDRIEGDDGDDYIDGGSGDDKLWGTFGFVPARVDDADTLLGHDGSDQLHGEAGDDRLAGGNGDDQLWGDEGNDKAGGGAGNDAANQIETPLDQIEQTLNDTIWATSCV